MMEFEENAGTQKKILTPKTARFRVLLSLLFMLPLGFASKFYRGPGAWWFNDYAGGLLYEVFWCLAAAFVWPRASGFRIARPPEPSIQPRLDHLVLCLANAFLSIIQRR